MNPENINKLNPNKQQESLYLYCWWSLVLRVFAMKRSASFSRFLEYSISISAFFLKKSWRSCSSWTLISVCWSRHFCCSTSCARISEKTREESKQIRMEQEPEDWALKILEMWNIRATQTLGLHSRHCVQLYGICFTRTPYLTKQCYYSVETITNSQTTGQKTWVSCFLVWPKFKRFTS